MCYRNAEGEQFWKRARRARASGPGGKPAKAAEARRKQASQTPEAKQEGKGQWQMLPGTYIIINEFLLYYFGKIIHKQSLKIL